MQPALGSHCLARVDRFSEPLPRTQGTWLAEASRTTETRFWRVEPATESWLLAPFLTDAFRAESFDFQTVASVGLSLSSVQSCQQVSDGVEGGWIALTVLIDRSASRVTPSIAP